jgi:hypothetical protein
MTAILTWIPLLLKQSQDVSNGNNPSTQQTPPVELSNVERPQNHTQSLKVLGRFLTGELKAVVSGRINIKSGRPEKDMHF